MEASSPPPVQSQVQPLTATGLDNPDLKFENLEPGLVWGVRTGHLDKEGIPQNVLTLIEENE